MKSAKLKNFEIHNSFLVQYISSASQLIAALAVENCFDDRFTRASHFLLDGFSYAFSY